jgi:Cu-Zn family superoxide dismutase
MRCKMSSLREGRRLAPWAAAVLVVALGCGGQGGEQAATGGSGSSESPGTAPAVATAVATLEGRSDVQLSGQATFTETTGGVRVTLDLTGTPPGPHGVHLHEIGDCSAPDATSAGAHFNPTGSHHGGHDTAERHAGDLGNIEVGADGVGHLDLTVPGLTVAPGPTSVVGRAIVVHADIDDLTTQPTGNSGARIGCGVIAAPAAGEAPGAGGGH